jgi:hypothetical protein
MAEAQAEAQAIEENECRICRCTAAEKDEPLFTPCQCRGSLKWVHPSCLEQWRQAAPNAASRVQCDTCRAPFNLQVRLPSETPHPQRPHTIIHEVAHTRLDTPRIRRYKGERSRTRSGSPRPRPRRCSALGAERYAAPSAARLLAPSVSCSCSSCARWPAHS